MTSDWQQETTNFVNELLPMAAGRKMKVIIAFGNDYFLHGPDPSWNACGISGWQGKWWQQPCVYTDRPDGTSRFTAFVRDSATWIDTLVDKVNNSAYASTVLYYDYQAEYTKALPNAGWYVTFLYQWSSIRAGQRGISLLMVAQPGDPNPDLDDVADLRYQFNAVFGSSWHLDFVAWDSYFDSQGANNTNIQASYDRVKGVFPDSTVLMSEFGSNSDYPSAGCCEAQQQGRLYDVVNAVRQKGIPYYLNWLLWDGMFGPNNLFGFAWGGHSRDQPKNVLGGFSQNIQSLILNGDMEQVSNGVPLHWSASGSGPVSLIAMGPYHSLQDGAATNAWYARVQANGQSSGSAWLSSEGWSVQGGGNIYLNGFIRSNMANVSMYVVEYDSSYNFLALVGGPAFTPSGWSWNNYLYHTAAAAGWSDGWHVTLRPDARIIIVMIHADIVSSPAYLDVDTVSVWETAP